MIRLETSWRYLCKRSWRRLEDVLKTFLQDVLKTSWRCLEDVFARRLEDVFWRRKAKANIFVLKTSWRRLLKTKTKDVFKTSSRLLRQDECLVWITVLKQEAEVVINWFSSNEIIANPNKFKLIILTKNKSGDIPTGISIGTDIVSVEKSVKRLRIHLDNRSNFNLHISTIC